MYSHIHWGSQNSKHEQRFCQEVESDWGAVSSSATIVRVTMGVWTVLPWLVSCAVC